PEHQAWLDKARQDLGPRLEAAGFSTEMCERIVAGCVCQAAERGYGGAGLAPQFLLGKDGHRLGVLHPSGVLQELSVAQTLAPGNGAGMRVDETVLSPRDTVRGVAVDAGHEPDPATREQAGRQVLERH
ncbi:MAG TPA: hypothetical protein DCM06_17735, partial [Comamonadaceae bacterium]|nr:hypothetical protein [Comamonadaceae bacterium]